MVITVSATSGVVYSLPKKLRQLEQQSSSALSHLDHQFIYQLRGQLEDICSSFEVYSTLENPTEFTRQWVQKVKEVAFDIEDSIDRYIYGVGDPGNEDSSGGTTLFRVAAYFVAKIKRAHAHLRSIPDELKLQQERLHVLMRRKETIRVTPPNLYSGDSGQTTTITTELQHGSSPVLFGFDEIRKEVSTMVMNVDSAAEGVRVTSIVGMAGAGKTSLAKKVYCQCHGSFDYLVFVSVGRKPHGLCTLLQRVLSGAPSGGIGVQHVDERDELKLKAIVREQLRDKRYLIVLDDLWSTETWRELMSCFPSNKLGSRIVTTTRIESVAKVCCSSPGDFVFRIPLLNESDSETLFFTRSFGSKNYCPPNLRDASIRILRKCNGLPLAIVKAADLIKKASITSAHEKFEMELQSMSYLHGIMKEELGHSYNDTPPQLKTCLLYLSIFPENYEIRRQRLVRRWIAEGFIDEENGENKEETGMSYFSELIDRNLIRPGHVDYDGNTRSCRVHPVIHDFIVCKSMEENFVTLVHPLGRQDATPDKKGAIRWLSVQCKAKEDQGTSHNKWADLSHTRSLSLFGDVGVMPQLTKMEMLRVLDLEGCQSSLDRNLDVLPRLFMLRYLSLKETNASRLPRQIGVLRHLEALDIRSTKIQELPTSIVNLHKLVYLRAERIPLPCGVGKLRALRTLSYADIRKSTASAVKELADLTNLMELAIFCSQEDRNDFIPVLKKLARHRFRSLIVAASNGCWMESSHSLPTPPLYSHQRFKIDESVFNTAIPEVVAMSSLANLVELDIIFQELSTQGLRVLESIGSLLRLCLWIMSVKEVQFMFQKDGFPNLRELRFRCRKLTSLSFGAGSFPKLKQLELNFEECSLSEEPTVSGLECLENLMHAIVASPREDAGTNKVVADVRKAALVHPNRPDVDIKMGKEILFPIGNISFGELGPDTFVMQREPESITYLFLKNQLKIQITFIMHWHTNAQKSSGGQSVLPLKAYCILLIIAFGFLPVLRSEWNQLKRMGVYMETGILVIIAYILLLLINFQYYILVPFPICLVGFIAYLYNEILVKGKLQQRRKRSDDTKKFQGLPVPETPSHLSRSKDRMEKELMTTAAIPYAILLFSLLCGDNNPVLSHFLLFSWCVLGTLTMMYSRLVDEVSPSLTPALRWIQMSYMIMIFITVHTMAAEWLGEVMALVCLPELIAGLVWFSAILHGGTCQVPCSETEKGAMYIPLGAVAASLATTYAYDGVGERLASWYMKATVACLIAGCMPYLSVWIISRWPSPIPRSDKVIRLLKFPANICLTGACLMLFDLLAEKALAYRFFGFDDLIDPSALKYLPGIYFTTAVALSVKHLADAFLHIEYVMELPAGFAAE